MPRSERLVQMAAYAKTNPSATNAQIAKELGVSSSYVSQMLSKSNKIKRKEGKLVVSG